LLAWARWGLARIRIVCRNSALPDELGPGDAVYAAALFDVISPAGLFCLDPSDGFGEHLPCTTLTEVR
jgi:hypothetical protein